MAQYSKNYNMYSVPNNYSSNYEGFEDYDMDRYNLTEYYPSYYNFVIPEGQEISINSYDNNYTKLSNDQGTFQTYFRPLTHNGLLSSYIKDKYGHIKYSNTEMTIVKCPYCGKDNELMRESQSYLNQSLNSTNKRTSIRNAFINKNQQICMNCRKKFPINQINTKSKRQITQKTISPYENQSIFIMTYGRIDIIKKTINTKKCTCKNKIITNTSESNNNMLIEDIVNQKSKNFNNEKLMTDSAKSNPIANNNTISNEKEQITTNEIKYDFNVNEINENNKLILDEQKKDINNSGPSQNINLNEQNLDSNKKNLDIIDINANQKQNEIKKVKVNNIVDLCNEKSENAKEPDKNEDMNINYLTEEKGENIEKEIKEEKDIKEEEEKIEEIKEKKDIKEDKEIKEAKEEKENIEEKEIKVEKKEKEENKEIEIKNVKEEEEEKEIKENIDEKEIKVEDKEKKEKEIKEIKNIKVEEEEKEIKENIDEKIIEDTNEGKEEKGEKENIEEKEIKVEDKEKEENKEKEIGDIKEEKEEKEIKENIKENIEEKIIKDGNEVKEEKSIKSEKEENLVDIDENKGHHNLIENNNLNYEKNIDLINEKEKEDSIQDIKYNEKIDENQINIINKNEGEKNKLLNYYQNKNDEINYYDNEKEKEDENNKENKLLNLNENEKKHFNEDDNEQEAINKEKIINTEENEQNKQYKFKYVELEKDDVENNKSEQNILKNTNQNENLENKEEKENLKEIHENNINVNNIDNAENEVEENKDINFNQNEWNENENAELDKEKKELLNNDNLDYNERYNNVEKDDKKLEDNNYNEIGNIKSKDKKIKEEKMNFDKEEIQIKNKKENANNEDNMENNNEERYNENEKDKDSNLKDKIKNGFGDDENKEKLKDNESKDTLEYNENTEQKIFEKETNDILKEYEKMYKDNNEYEDDIKYNKIGKNIDSGGQFEEIDNDRGYFSGLKKYKNSVNNNEKAKTKLPITGEIIFHPKISKRRSFQPLFKKEELQEPTFQKRFSMIPPEKELMYRMTKQIFPSKFGVEMPYRSQIRQSNYSFKNSRSIDRNSRKRKSPDRKNNLQYSARSSIREFDIKSSKSGNFRMKSYSRKSYYKYRSNIRSDNPFVGLSHYHKSKKERKSIIAKAVEKEGNEYNKIILIEDNIIKKKELNKEELKQLINTLSKFLFEDEEKNLENKMLYEYKISKVSNIIKFMNEENRNITMEELQRNAKDEYSNGLFYILKSKIEGYKEKLAFTPIKRVVRKSIKKKK